MLNLLGSIAEFERELMLERQREGIAKAKAEGKYKGRAPTARAKAKEVLALRAEGLTGNAIAERLAIGRASVFRILRDAAQPTSHRRHDMVRSLNEGALSGLNESFTNFASFSVQLSCFDHFCCIWPTPLSCAFISM